MDDDRKELEEKIAKLDPNNGWRVTQVNNVRGWSLHLTAWYKDKNCDPLRELKLGNVLWWGPKDMCPADNGSLQRTKILAAAMCDFLNTGGTRDELEKLYGVFYVAADQLPTSMIPDYVLVSSQLGDGGTLDNIFYPMCDAAGKYPVRWVVDEYFEVLDWADVEGDSDFFEVESDDNDSPASAQPLLGGGGSDEPAAPA